MCSLSFSMSTPVVARPTFSAPSNMESKRKGRCLEGRDTMKAKLRGNMDFKCSGKIQIAKSGLVVPVIQSQPVWPKHIIMRTRRLPSTTIIQASALNARCSEGQTQTVQRQQSSITIAPVQGKEKSPDLDDGGSGFPPRDDGDGGGGGGGGGGGWSGGFFFFGLLAFLGFLKDKESEGPYRDSRRR